MAAEDNLRDNLIVLPDFTSADHTKPIQTDEDRINVFKSSIHDRQATRLKWGKDSEDRKIATFKSLLHRKIASAGYKRL